MSDMKMLKFLITTRNQGKLFKLIQIGNLSEKEM